MSIYMKSLLTMVLLWGLGYGLMAQSFAPRILDFSRKEVSFLTLKDGTEVAGYYQGGRRSKGLFKAITFEDTTTGEKTRYDAEDIASMRLVASGWGKFAATSEGAGSLTRMQNTDFDALDRDYIYFEQARLPGKKERYVLLQLVNPGFDSKLKIFDDPRAAQTGGIAMGGVAMTGGNLKSYYVVRDGEAYLIKKGKYKKEFLNIYGNCAHLKQTFDKIKWLDFAEHVYAHEQHCE